MKHMIFGALFFVMPLQLLAAESEYPMTDVCRATLNSMLNRDLSIMNATQIEDGSVRVQYTRPQDGKLFSYRCRSTDGSTISILDENISGPRWYGELPDDIQRSYRIKDEKLIIRSFSPLSETSSEKFYSHAEFPLKKNSKDTLSDFLQTYGSSIAKNYLGGKLKFTRAYHVVQKPLNSYRLDFETSAKELLSNPAGSDNDDIYNANFKKTEAWENAFCTAELKKFMQEKNIDMVSGFIISKQKNQSIAACLK